ncbi:MAG: hypothetical protein EGR46_00205 [Ruminococcus sp.]|nr:hypothetical protein [Ruminococcus sp.]
MYGVQLIISSIINFLICIITSLLFGELLNGLIFFVAFSSLRKFTGGFHSRSFLICNIVFTMIVVVALISNMLIGAIFAGTPMIVLLIILTMLSAHTKAAIAYANSHNYDPGKYQVTGNSSKDKI